MALLIDCFLYALWREAVIFGPGFVLNQERLFSSLSFVPHFTVVISGFSRASWIKRCSRGHWTKGTCTEYSELAKLTFQALVLRQNKTCVLLCLAEGLTRRFIDLHKFQSIEFEMFPFPAGATRSETYSETNFS